jgi:hypothetical protein
MIKASSKLVILLVTVVIALVLASPAFALTTSATTTRDMDHPGMMKRVIFSECQVAQYPVNVTHAGYIHAELNFNSGWDSNYLSVFIWDERNFQFQNINQGWYLIGTGKAVVDYNVQSITTEGKVLVDEDTVPDSGDEYLVGDNYWIIVVVSNDWNSKFNVTGYSPQIDLTAGYGANTQNENNFYLQKFNLPGKDVKQRLIGVPYGNPFDFKPTSEGDLTTDLTYPANAKEKTVSDDLKNGNAPAIWEQYVYAGGDWDLVISN